MSIFNLSEEYKNSGASFYKKMIMIRGLDIYQASSLFAMEDFFNKNLPKKIDKGHKIPAAYVILRNLRVKEFDNRDFNIDDPADVIGIDGGFINPHFIIKDNGYKRLVGWNGRNSKRYKENLEEFRLNDKTYKIIPKTFIKYLIDPNGGDLILINHFSWDQKTKTKKKSLKDKIYDLIPDGSEIIFEPSFG